MIMPRGTGQLLMPANPIFIAFSLMVALGLNLIPMGRQPSMPDFLALVMVFWNVHQSRRVGVGLAFCFGLVMDVHQGALLGQHALAYTLLSYGAVALHRRLLWFAMLPQTIQVFPLFVAAHLVSLLIRMLMGGMWPGWGVVLAPIFESILWPLVSMLLLAPQRRPPDPDKDRPL